MNKILYLCVLLVLSSQTQAAQPRPNILLIMAEDMSARVGAFGDEVAVTPNLDKLANRAVRYPNTFTTAGVCAPSRTSHILGMHQISVGGQHMRTRDFKDSNYLAVPPPHVKAFPEILRGNGYATFTNNKLDYQFSTYPAFSGPFTIWDLEGANGHWRNLPNKSQPFFGFITIETTHESRMFSERVAKNRATNGWQEPVLEKDVIVPDFLADTPEVRKDLAQHYNNIFNMDKRVGQLLTQLEQDGLLDNTIVVWTTDHGDGLPRAKREIYDSGIKVPMMIAWPKRYQPDYVRAGAVDNKLISFVDFAPSFLQMANVTAPVYFHGGAQFGINPPAPRQYIYASKDRLDEFLFRERAIRSKKFKYIKNYLPGKPGGTKLAYREQLASMQSMWEMLEAGKLTKAQEFWFSARPKEELYDIETDPFELNNLASDSQYQQTMANLRFALESKLKRIGDLSEQSELTLAQTFWPEGVQPVTPAPKITYTEQLVTVTSDLVGASIGYQIDNNPWALYSKPVQLKKGQYFKAKAVRYGWLESDVVNLAN